ncbi:hypothetical protein PVAND_010734 [Polypedilum vanderplanki]|uniref:Uncharacterized protein n=1 Tax=Polypedilum vanderplanki TaxID=319348 RepID=A0A9J6CHQ7_POLVA|nr:hypothetical protein PVAND_010734 [Polypedilum vanderplanki]
MKVLNFFFILAAIIGNSFSLCIWPKTAGILNVCKQLDKEDCIGLTSNNICIDLNGGLFVSGYASGNYQCTIFSSTDCLGTSATVDKLGWSHFPIIPKSFKCPCV